MTDEIVLSLPRERRFYDVAHLVVGGLAVRLNLTVDSLSDLQVALSGLLPRAESADEVMIILRLEGETLAGRIGPFDARSLQAELQGEGGDGYGVHHVLETVFESHRVEVEGEGAWVDFTMDVTAAPRAD